MNKIPNYDDEPKVNNPEEMVDGNFYYCAADGAIYAIHNYPHDQRPSSIFLRDIRNCFKTLEQAEKYRDIILRVLIFNDGEIQQFKEVWK